jgi:hypothetical protein
MMVVDATRLAVADAENGQIPEFAITFSAALSW